MSERDWQKDWDWVNSPDVCITERMQELANYWLLRARGLEDVLKNVQCIIGRSLEDTMQEKIAAERRGRELEEENRRLRAVAEAARAVRRQWMDYMGDPLKITTNPPLKSLFLALADLDGERKEA